jgi:hypothetical protein
VQCNAQPWLDILASSCYKSLGMCLCADEQVAQVVVLRPARSLQQLRGLQGAPLQDMGIADEVNRWDLLKRGAV